MRMKWETLLSTARIKTLFGQKATSLPPQDLRTQFERDYDRAIFSTTVRRLQDKAQVFIKDPSDAVRTRLTHSLEVSTVARDFGRQIGKWLVETKEVTPSEAYDIEVIASTCGLIHDLGNPPFGHAGERAISHWFKRRLEQDKNFFNFGEGATDSNSQYAQDFLKFEGNAQTVRLLCKLQMLADLNGLNITCGTFSAACKYTAASHQTVDEVGPHEKTKPGFFASEADLINSIRKETGTEDRRNPITFLTEACDDMVYLTVDIEDAIRKRILRWDQVEDFLKDDKNKVDQTLLGKCIDESRNYIKKGGLEMKGHEFDEAMAQCFRTYAIREIFSASREEFKKQYANIMEGKYNGELTRDCSASSLVNAFGTIGREMIYNSPQTLKLEVMGRRVITDLMDLFWEGAEKHDGSKKTRNFPGKIFALLSINYRRVYEDAIKKGTLPARYCRMQLVTDYICGMTDTFACRLHKELGND
jgi:dGTPase